jgi:hypothetical protein
MDEEFGSFVVTDPDIVDPGIDVSGLKTQTDTSLLGNIPDFAGIQYEAFNPNRLSDLMRLYGTGLPMIDTPAAATPPDTGGGGSGDGGQATIPIDAPTFDDGVTSDEGFIEIQPDTGGITSDPIEMENIASNPYDIPMNIDDPGASIENIIAQNPSETIPGRPDIFDINQTGDPSQNMLDVPTTEVLGTGVMPAFGDMPTEFTLGPAYTGEFDPYDEGTVFDTSGLTDATPEQQESFLQNVLGQAGQTVEGALTQLGKIPGAIVDIANQTVDVFGKKLNVGKTLAGLAINRIVGGPVSLVFDALQSLPKSKSQLQYEGFNDDQRAAIDQAYGPGGVMEGYNAVSAFGDGPLVTIQERIDNRYANVSDPANDPTIKELERLRDTLGGIEAVDAVKTGAPQEDIGAIPGDTGADPITGDLPGGGNIVDEFAPSDDKDDSPAPSTPSVNEADVEAGLATESISDFDANTFDDDLNFNPPSAPTTLEEMQEQMVVDRGGDPNQDDSPVETKTDPNTGLKQSTYDAEEEDFRDVGGDSSSDSPGGKIVCTMMNESYGFGSFRNKIWLRHSEDLAPEYQKGYHKIFLPLVRLSKNNKILKKMLEHIAVHRTIDIRQEARGKVHLLGRVYRKILEPICYWVGKYAK